MTRLSTLRANEFNRALVPEKETVTRWIFGNRESTEDIDVVLQIDSGAAGAPTSEGGIRLDTETLQVEQSAVMEVAAAQEISHEDRIIYDGDQWRVMGDAIGSDQGSKTYVLRRVRRLRGRQPNVNTRA